MDISLPGNEQVMSKSEVRKLQSMTFSMECEPFLIKLVVKQCTLQRTIYRHLEHRWSNTGYTALNPLYERA